MENDDHIKAMLSAKELVQVNATIIAGVLIFITLAQTSFSDKSSSIYRFIITSFTASVLVPYALSAKLALDANETKSTTYLKFGLMYSVAVAAVFVILSYLVDVARVLN
jgi:hypothetical protein